MIKPEFKNRIIKYSIDILKFADNLKKYPNLWSSRDQLIRSGTSVGANIIEGQYASSKKDYINFFHIALKSANETTYWLDIIEGYEPELKNKMAGIRPETIELIKILTSSILTMKKTL